MLMRMLSAALCTGLLLLLASAATAAPSLDGTAAIVSTPDVGHPTALSETSTGFSTYGAATFTMPAGTTFGQFLSNGLGADFNVQAGQFGGGSPRFSINTPSGNIQVSFGSFPNYTDSFALNTWHNSGNLLGPGTFVDTTHLSGGAFYDPIGGHANTYGGLTVTSVSLITDGGWAVPGGTQSFLFDNININGTIYSGAALATPEPASLAVWGAMSVLGAAFGWRRRRAS
jgi:hypothetical protein